MAIKTLEQFTAEAQTEIDAIKTANGGDGLFKSTPEGRVEYSDADYSQAVTDSANRKLDEQDNGYKWARELAYPSIGDQLDMQYHDAVNGTTTWKDAIAKVKSDNPKPS